ARPGRERRAHGRGHRRLRRYPPDHRRSLRPVRPASGDRHPDQRGWVRRGGHRHGDDRPAARRRGDDLELLLPGGRPDHPERGQGPVLLRRAGQGPAGDTRAQRRGGATLRPAHPLAGVVLRALPRPEGGSPGDPERRQGDDAHRGPGRQLRDLPRGRRAVRDQGGGCRGRQRRPVRPGPDRAGGWGRHAGLLRPAGGPVPGRGRTAGRGRHRGRGHRPAQPAPPGRGDRRRLRSQDPPRGGCTGAVALVRGGQRGGGDHPGPGVRRPRRPGRAGERGGGPCAVCAQSRDRRLPERGPGRGGGAPGALPRRGVTMPEVLMPKMGDAMEAGTLSSWLKHEGDQVEVGDALAEIETDKTTMELEAEDAGVLTRVIAREGDAEAVGEPIAVISADGEAPDAAPDEARQGADETEDSASGRETAETQTAETQTAKSETAETKAAKNETAEAETAETKAAETEATESGERGVRARGAEAQKAAA